MEAENWHQVKEILEHAIEQSADEREHFIEEKCSGDVSLREKIDSLISSYERVGDFMEDGPMGSVADMFAPNDEIQPGERLGRYEVVRVLGEGGMGKVYLADDPDLHRQVAIKVLRNDLWWYKQARQRLSREARAAARLDHPNICSIFEIEDSDERSFIVMQYVEGYTLGDVMAKGGLGGRESLRIALQIAGALEEAHSHHIIHRDIKPANIIINEKRQVKVLDFGLAKSIKPGSEENEMDLSSSGAVMGTVPYMSPEQLRGKTVDGRSDIFSLGALLYEMLSGRQAFRKESNAETISYILNDEPDLSIVPASFRPIVEKSLRKRAGDRYQSISDVAKDLQSLESGTVEDTVPDARFSNWFGAKSVISSAFRRYFSDRIGNGSNARPLYHWQDSDSDARTVRLTEPVLLGQTTERHPLTIHTRPVLLIGISIFAIALIPTFLYLSLRPQSDPHSFDSLRSVRLVEWKEAASNIYLGYSSSRNGKMIAYSTTQDGPNESIFVKQIGDGGGAQVTKDKWKNYSPIWSPDDQQLAFISIRNGAYGIYTSAFLGGGTTLIKSIDAGTVSLRHWSNDGLGIYYEFNGNLFQLNLETRQAEQLTSFESSASAARGFSFSPDEKKVVYCDQVNGQTDLWMASANSGERRRLTNDPQVENAPVWHPDGKRIVYSVLRNDHHQINVVYLDGREPEQVTRGDGEYELIDISADGKNVFYTTWEDRSDVWRINTDSGVESQVVAGKESEFWPDVSPDGKSVLYQTNSALNPVGSLWASSVVVNSLGSIEPSKRINGFDPRWLPDGRHLAFLRWQGPETGSALWTLDTVTGEEKAIVEENVPLFTFGPLPYNRFQAREFSWSPDSSEVAYLSYRSGMSNILTKMIGTGETTVLSQNSDQSTTFYCPMYSPDGLKIAYVSVQKPADGGAGITTHVWINQNGNAKETFSTSESLRLIGWSGNNNLVVASTDGRMKANPLDIKIVRISILGELDELASLKSIYAQSLVLSPDGKTVAFTGRQNEKDDIFTVSFNSRSVKKISANTSERIYFGSLAWSPDGKNIFFDKQERINTISMFENFK